MPEGRLVIGTKRYSSWSMRGWLAVHLAGLEVEEVMIPLAGGGGTSALKTATPTGLVPYLEHRGARVWESLAICEYCAEIAPKLWPAERAARAHARSIAAEMHAGFRNLRMAMPMNLGRSFPGRGRTPECLADIARVEAIWVEAIAAHGGPFLMGAEFGAADAMYAPVVTRFATYSIPVSADTRAYMDAVLNTPSFRTWHAAAMAEPFVVAADEIDEQAVGPFPLP